MHNLQVQPSHYRLWEDYRAGMYQTRTNEDTISEAIVVLTNPTWFREALLAVAKEWPLATSQHLSDFCKNHQPWCGRLATCFEVGATIKETNEAWKFLTWQQREAANAVADSFTFAWRTEHLQGQLSWMV